MANRHGIAAFDEEYRIPYENIVVYDHIIGTGNFGEVRRGVLKNPNENEVVWKTLKKTDINAINSDMLATELKNQRDLNHPNIVRAFGWVSYLIDGKDVFGIVLEFVDGGGLDEAVSNHVKVPYTRKQVVSWALQAANGLKYMHSIEAIKLVHRDIKPANMLLNASRTVLKISDFGLAKELTSYARSEIGSPLYMAPEMFKDGDVKYNEMCDVYSWALSFWECFSYNRPFGECTRRQQLRISKQRTDYRLEPIPGVSQEIQDLIHECSSYDSNQRPTMAMVFDRMKVLNEMIQQ